MMLKGEVSYGILLLWIPSFYLSTVFSISAIVIHKNIFSWTSVSLNYLSLLVLEVGTMNDQLLSFFYHS